MSPRESQENDYRQQSAAKAWLTEQLEPYGTMQIGGQHGLKREHREFPRNKSFSSQRQPSSLTSGLGQAVLWYNH